MGKKKAKDRGAGGADQAPAGKAPKKQDGNVRELDFAELKSKFDAVVEKHKLDVGTKADEITDFIMGKHINAAEFGERFGLPVDDAHIFLSWIQVGLKFQAEVAQNADALSGAGAASS